jgi:Domain of unknown function (DUF4345)
MNFLLILKIIGAAGTAIVGVVGLIWPTSIYGFTGLTAAGPRGISEIRAIFGGLFIALGLAPFLFGEDAYRVLGFAYLAIAVARLVSIVLDKSYASSNWISLAIEVVFGVILILK